MIMQQQTYGELCNLLIQSLEAKDEAALLKVLQHEDEAVIREIVNKVPVHHVRKLIIEMRNLLSNELTTNHLRWLQQILASKFSVISSMADGRSILLPLISLLDDRSSPAYYMKVQTLKGKLTLLKQLKEARKSDIPETVVRIPIERDPSTHMEIDAESETESEEDFDGEENSNVDEEEGGSDAPTSDYDEDIDRVNDEDQGDEDNADEDEDLDDSD